MKIALISDIHSNIFALEAVLAHAESLGVKQFWCLGDLVHFNAFPQEVVKTIRKLDPVCVYGNMDCSVLEARKLLAKKKKENISEGQQALIWTYSQLSRKSREYLSDLPMKKRLKINGNRFLLIHGSPAGYDDPIFIDTPEDRLRELTKLTNAEFVICGHTHKQFVREVDGVTFINPGSAGKPLDGDPRACYSILKIKQDSVAVEPYRVEYDVANGINGMKEANLPELFIRSIELALGHDKVTELLEQKAEKQTEG